MNVSIDEIKVGKRFRRKLGSLISLVKSIKELGLLHPVVVSKDYELIAGWRRLKAVQMLGWKEIPVTIVDLEDLRQGEVQENLARKNFAPSEMVAIKKALEPEIKKAAEQRMKASLKRGNKIPARENFHSGKKGKSLDILGGYVGVSGKTLEKAEYVVEAAEENPSKFGKLVSKMDDGKISINAAATQVRRAKKHIYTPKLPEDKYDIIYADPPWKYDFCLEGDPKEHYAELSTQAICDLKIPTPDDAMLFLWVTNPKIVDALKVVKAWGFKYVTNIVWVKQTKGLGYYTLAQHELLFICKKGNMPPPQAEDRISSAVHADRTTHSTKPELFYDVIKKMYPNRKYLELFARIKREGWQAWGNQLEK